MNKIITLSLILIFTINCRKPISKKIIKKTEINRFNFLEKETEFQYIYDFGNLISTKKEILLKEKVINYFNNKGAVLMVITIDYMGNYNDVYEYATNIRNIFNDNLNNTNITLILISNKNKKLAISSNLKPNISNNFYNSIIDTIIIPKMKNEKYFEGVNLAIDEIISKYNNTN